MRTILVSYVSVVTIVAAAVATSIGVAGAQSPPQTSAQPTSQDVRSLSSRMGVFAFPTEGQTFEQQTKDEDACYKWGVQNTGQDPFQIVKNAQAAVAATEQNAQATAAAGQGAGARGAVKGAAAGAVVGAIADDTGKGAAIGAGVGVVAGRAKKREAEKVASASQAQAQQIKQDAKAQVEVFKKAFAGCLESKKYSVKY